MIRTSKYVLYDIVRNRFVILYAVFLLVATLGMMNLDSDPGKSMLSLLNVVLLIVPLVSVVFTTTHFFNSYEFIELLLSQPVERKSIFLAEYFSVSLALTSAFLFGVGMPVLLLNFNDASLYLILSGVLLTFVFVALAFGASLSTRDKAKGIGIAMLFWLYFSLLYDGVVLYIIYSFSDYPLEKITLVLVSLNPVDLARIIILLKLDVSALMGYTGAFYREFFGTNLGIFYSFLFLMAWIAVPLMLSLKRFEKKDI